MKRIQYACLNQTVHFKLKEDMGRDYAIKLVKDEYAEYKNHLESSNIKHKIIAEETQPDGSIIIKIKRQLNNYDVGDYLD